MASQKEFRFNSQGMNNVMYPAAENSLTPQKLGGHRHHRMERFEGGTSKDRSHREGAITQQSVDNLRVGATIANDN